jgi:hypothetical protein
MHEVLGLDVTDLTPEAVRQAVRARGATVTNENEYTTDLRLTGVRWVDRHIRTSGIPQYGKANFNFTDGRLASIYISRRMPRAEFEQRVRELSAKLPLEMRKDTFVRFRDRGTRLQVDLSLNVSTDGAWVGEWWQGLQVPCEAGSATRSRSLPRFTVTRATTPDGRSIRVEYVMGTAPNQRVHFRVYRSSEPRLNGSESSIGEETVTTVGMPKADQAHEAVILRERDLVPIMNKPYVVVVGEAGGQASTAYFRKHMLGVIVHGYTFKARLAVANQFQPTRLATRDWLLNNQDVEDWQDDMKNALELVHCYNAETFAFNWRYESVSELASLLTSKGRDLFAEVERRATAMATQHDGDVVDVHFIAHSRGTVLVGQALVEWAKRKSPALGGSYVRLTLLDPHPANNSVPLQEDVEPGKWGTVFYADYKQFQEEVKDPPVVLPSGAGIRQISVFFQQSRVTDVQSDPPDLVSRWSPINLWGQGGSIDLITRNNWSGVPIEWHRLKAFPTGEVINHSAVVTYYERELWAHQSPLYHQGGPTLGSCLPVPR